MYKGYDPDLFDLVTKSTYVGCVDENFALIQSELDLLLINIRNLNEDLFYQIILVDFGNLNYYKFPKPLPLADILSVYFRVNASDVDNVNDKINKLVDPMVTCSQMLDDYFSIKINPKTSSLEALPLLAKDHFPIMAYLPDFLFRFANVNWYEEEGCFQDVATELARFYARTPSKLTTEQEYLSWSKVVEHVFFPLYKSLIFPSNDLKQKQTFHTVANITNLYKVFERC